MTATADPLARISHSDLNAFLRDASQYYSAGALYLRTQAEYYRVGQSGVCIIELPVLKDRVQCNARITRRLPHGVIFNVIEWDPGHAEKLWKFVALAWSMLQAAGLSNCQGKPPLPASKVNIKSLVKLQRDPRLVATTGAEKSVEMAEGNAASENPPIARGAAFPDKITAHPTSPSKNEPAQPQAKSPPNGAVPSGRAQNGSTQSGSTQNSAVEADSILGRAASNHRTQSPTADNLQHAAHDRASIEGPKGPAAQQNPFIDDTHQVENDEIAFDEDDSEIDGLYFMTSAHSDRVSEPKTKASTPEKAAVDTPAAPLYARSEDLDDDSAGFYTYKPPGQRSTPRRQASGFQNQGFLAQNGAAQVQKAAPAPSPALNGSAQSLNGSAHSLNGDDFSEKFYHDPEDDDLDDEGFYSFTPSSRKAPKSIRHGAHALNGQDESETVPSAASASPSPVEGLAAEAVGTVQSPNLPWDEQPDPNPAAEASHGDGAIDREEIRTTADILKDIEAEISQEWAVQNPDFEVTEEAVIPNGVSTSPPRFQFDDDYEEEFDHEFDVDFDEDELTRDMSISGLSHREAPLVAQPEIQGEYMQRHADGSMSSQPASFTNALSFIPAQPVVDVDPMAGLYDEDQQVPFEIPVESEVSGLLDQPFTPQFIDADDLEITIDAPLPEVEPAAPLRRLPPRPIFIKAPERQGKNIRLNQKCLAMVMHDLQGEDWSGWIEMDSHNIIRRLRFESGQLVHMEERPFPALGLLNTAATNIPIHIKDFSPYELLISTDDFPEHTLASQGVLNHREASTLMGRRVSLQVTKAIDEGFVGEVWLQKDKSEVEAISPRPSPKVPLSRLIWSGLRTQGYEQDCDMLLGLLKELNWSGLRWNDEALAEIEVYGLRSEEIEALKYLRGANRRDIMAELEDDSEQALVLRTTAWILLRLGLLQMDSHRVN